MTFKFNIFQEIFLVSFSILYGVMLQNMMGRKINGAHWQPFPWYQAYREPTMVLRLLFSILVQNVGPFLYGIVVFWFLGFFKYGLGNCQGWFLIFIVFWVALGVFGFQRLYGFLAVITHRWKPDLFKELYEIMREQNDGVSLKWKPALIPVLYYFTSLISLFMSLIINPLFGVITIILTIIIFVILVPLLRACIN